MSGGVGVRVERLVLVDDDLGGQAASAESDDARVGDVEIVDEHIGVSLLRPVPPRPRR